MLWTGRETGRGGLSWNEIFLVVIRWWYCGVFPILSKLLEDTFKWFAVQFFFGNRSSGTSFYVVVGGGVLWLVIKPGAQHRLKKRRTVA